MNVPKNTQQAHWYPMVEEKPGRAPLKFLPMFEDLEDGFSVDVLVFGYLTDKGAEYQNIPCFALGYVNRKSQWHFYTVNGTYPDADNAITDFIPLMWQYLPDEPCDVPSVNSLDKNEKTVAHSKAVNSPDAMTSPNTDWPYYGKAD